MTEKGPRQFNALYEDKDKVKLIKARTTAAYWVRTGYGKGEIYRSSLLVKLLILIINKVSLLDPEGIGIEMEAGKPGWYDALNGLPGLFGSSTPETMELMRLCCWLKGVLIDIDDSREINLPEEANEFYIKLRELIENDLLDPFSHWEKRCLLREEYRERVFMGFSGKELRIKLKEIRGFLEKLASFLEKAVNQARNKKTGLYYTYFRYIPVEYSLTGETVAEKWKAIKAKKFKKQPLPLFLEGQVRAMEHLPGNKTAELHKQVMKSELYDKKLEMFRLNGDLSEMPPDIGRARAFSPGWLENGSIWLH
ncbi:MAG TPA: hypothetical protein VKY40_03430, partial [Halanaerobiales bacterium]|nr:hypothetical protein [Halanaerobiales bacterium]